MFLKQLEASQFRNLVDISVAFPGQLNVICGQNGQGKTNLLEAIQLLTSGQSYRAGRNLELVQWGSQRSQLKGSFETHLGPLTVELVLSDGQRSVRLDGKKPHDREELASRCQAVLFSPDDLHLIRGSPSGRRAYLDQAICRLYPRYVDISRQYAQICQQKNRLLQDQTATPRGLEVWNERQAELGARITRVRQRFVARIIPEFERAFRAVSGGGLSVGLTYVSEVASETTQDEGQIRRSLLEALQDAYPEERRLRRTMIGPHRDDLRILLQEQDAGRFGSQGQVRMLAMCLKMVELEVLRQDRGILPVLLLDDISSELDAERNAFLMNHVGQLGCQVFVTTTSLEGVTTGCFNEVLSYQVVGGRILPS